MADGQGLILVRQAAKGRGDEQVTRDFPHDPKHGGIADPANFKLLPHHEFTLPGILVLRALDCPEGQRQSRTAPTPETHTTAHGSAA